MRIETPTTIEQTAWEGELVPKGLNETFRGAAEAVRVTLGEPVWWSAAQAMATEADKKWTPPAGDRQYTLIRLACTLYAPVNASTRFTEATLSVFLRPRQGGGLVFAQDLLPQRLTAETTGKKTAKLTPEFKFADAISLKVGELGAEIDYRKVFPVIQGYGLGESRPSWEFSHHAANPLVGSQFVYLVAAAPGDADGIRLSVELIATVETRFGPLRLGLPDTARANVSRNIPAT